MLMDGGVLCRHSAAFSQGKLIGRGLMAAVNRERERYFSEWCDGLWAVRDDSEGCETPEKSALRAFDSGGQATKGAWGMSWHQEALKGAEGCDKPGVAVKQAIIPGFPNWHVLNP